MHTFYVEEEERKRGVCCNQVDMSRVYDRVDWLFMEKIMRKMGFHERWISIIILCISTVNYQVKVNRFLTEVITPRRGLRHGDLLSPYIFLLCVEGFSSLLNRVGEEGELEGIKIYQGAPRFNHILFAYGSLVLIKDTREGAKPLQKVLQLYEVC